MKWRFCQPVLGFLFISTQGWDAKHLLSIFLSQKLYVSAGEVQAAVPAVTLLLLKVCLKPDALCLKLKYLYFSLSAVWSTWNMLMVMWTTCPFCCKQQWKKSAQRISAALEFTVWCCGLECCWYTVMRKMCHECPRSLIPNRDHSS